MKIIGESLPVGSLINFQIITTEQIINYVFRELLAIADKNHIYSLPHDSELFKGDKPKMRRVIGLTLLAAIPLTLIAGDLVGTITYEGKPPKRKKLRMDSDPICGASHQEAVFNESFILDEKGNLANVLVYLKGVKYEGGTPEDSAVLDQRGCMYVPHVSGVVAGQEVKILNSDATMHNIHGLPKVNKEFNFGMPKTVKQKLVTFDKVEDVFVVKCDVHPWMKSYVQVFGHPYFAVTSTDGSYSISGIPPGEYEVVAWQEKFSPRYGILQETVVIGEDSTELNLTFKRPEKKE